MSDDNTDFMMVAIELARSALTTPGLRPFAAVIVRDGRIIGRGVNRVEERSDPTSHGEVEAIRDACARHGVDLSGCDLYTTCEPCIMCVASMEAAGIARIFYAASLASAGEALAPIRPGFVSQFETMRAHVCTPLRERPASVFQQHEQAAVDILRAWAAGQAGKAS